MSTLSKLTAFFLAGSVVMPAAAANNLNLPHEPMTVLSSRVDPNVMLLIDNSGSMNNAIWHADYDPTTATPGYTQNDDWVQRRSSDDKWYYMSNQGDTTLSSVDRDNNGAFRFAYYKNGSLSSEYRLYLPDPAPGTRQTRYNNHYLKWVLETYGKKGQTVDLRSILPDEYRMAVAREVSKNIVRDVEGVRFGVAKLNSDNNGGHVVAECEDKTSSYQSGSYLDKKLIPEIDALKASTNTPISEAYYGITRYFRGIDNFWNGEFDYKDKSPILYRCQKNFTIIISDGVPTKDTFRKNDSDSQSVYSTVRNDKITGMSNTLPDWNNDGETYFLDDVAQFARDLDMKTGGLDKANKSFDDPDFPKQNMDTYTVGFALDHELLKNTAEKGNGVYYTANNSDQLTKALESALADISDKILTASSAAVTQGVISADSLAIFPEFNSRYWTGDLKAYKFDTDPESPTYLQLVQEWASAADKLNGKGWSGRHIITSSAAGKGMPFRWGSFSGVQREELFSNDEGLLQYLRGDRSREGSDFRKREGVLGDIVYSSPQYIAEPAFRYPDQDYQTFKKDNKNREGVVYVGANDGMLHAFKGSTGEELIAFIPSAVHPQLYQLAKKDYSHRFYVDGTPTIVDAKVGGQWRTILVGGLNRGGMQIYALDVTDPSSFKESNAQSIFKWEFTDPDLGYTYSRPGIIQLQDGTWAAVFGNGYNSTQSAGLDGGSSGSGDAVLFIVDLHTGSLIKKISTDVGVKEDPTGEDRPNGLATVTPADVDGDHKADYVYAGDLFGNVWKFDLTGTQKNKWGVGNSGKPLFVACGGDSCSKNNRQPITTAVTISRHPQRGVMVFFGTGKYLETVDKSSAGSGLQSLYGIWDADTGKTVERTSLLEQTITYQGAVTKNGKSQDVRLTSDNDIDWSKHQGWYLDLNKPASERVVRKPTLRNGRIIFTTLLPLIDEVDLCKSEAESWLMELDAISGGVLDYPVYDLNGDGKFDKDDYAGSGSGPDSSQPPSGVKFDGEKPGPSILPVGPNKELKIIDKNTVLQGNPGLRVEGRLGWREISG